MPGLWDDSFAASAASVAAAACAVDIAVAVFADSDVAAAVVVVAVATVIDGNAEGLQAFESQSLVNPQLNGRGQGMAKAVAGCYSTWCFGKRIGYSII